MKTTDWRTVPLWSVATETRVAVDPSDLGDQVVHYSIPAVDATGTGQVEATDSIKSAKLRLQGGEVLVSKLNPRKSRVLIVTESPLPIVSSTEFVGLLPGAKLEPRFLAYFLQSEATRQALDSQVQSVTRSHQRVAPEDVTHLPIRLPSLDEQHRIAQFLDAETARIDKLIRLQGLVVERLDERERAQLDSALDELINRWGSVPLRRFLRGVDQGTSPQADAVPAGADEWGVLKVSCLRPGRFFPNENKRLPPSLEPEINHEVRPGDLLITRANTPQLVGSTAVVPPIRGKLLLSDKIFRVRIDKRITTEFVATVARGTRIRDLCAASSNGASQSMANIRFEEVKAWPLPAAPLDAQHDLVRSVNRQRSVLDDLRTKVERQSRLLTERRQALITAAVTGHFDVTTASGRNVIEGVTA
ncbi:hypothetical protein GCM10010266_62800 [Streptomyces griseomycini]|uniref:restriction endonuclease subunit S n=1 Tax=Streptomyces griseomycini TaxID=66895 RepID=UPI001874CD24|nr:restriction endonuclease subunit S [Streptomyces griseomycini]GGQ30970.1 hypothetical protein GCM10010266_62800 [Streptomyces griseomycini]